MLNQSLYIIVPFLNALKQEQDTSGFSTLSLCGPNACRASRGSRGHQCLASDTHTSLENCDENEWLAKLRIQSATTKIDLISCTGAQVFSTKKDLLLNILPQQCLNNTTAHSYLFPKILDLAWNYWFRSATVLYRAGHAVHDFNTERQNCFTGKTNVVTLHKVCHYRHCFWAEMFKIISLPTIEF